LLERQSPDQSLQLRKQLLDSKRRPSGAATIRFGLGEVTRADEADKRIWGICTPTHRRRILSSCRCQKGPGIEY